MAKGYDVVIGYGELGDADINQIKQKGFKARYVPMYRGGINLFNEIKT